MPRPFSLFPVQFCLSAAACLASGRSASAGFTYDESTAGDLSADRFSPTDLTLEPGSNILIGTFGPSGTPDLPDLDYLTLTVPPGFILDRVEVLQADVGGAFSFIGVEAGDQVSVPWDTSDASTLLGWAHFGTTYVGVDMLPEMAAGGGAIGFTPPLPAGHYTFWIMELDGSRPYNYSFDFHLSPAPCRADWNNDGTLDAFDYDDFVSAYFDYVNNGAGFPDYNGDTYVDAFDYDDFVSEFFTGCD